MVYAACTLHIHMPLQENVLTNFLPAKSFLEHAARSQTVPGELFKLNQTQKLTGRQSLLQDLGLLQLW
jgi:hypothetical protein